MLKALPPIAKDDLATRAQCIRSLLKSRISLLAKNKWKEQMERRRQEEDLAAQQLIRAIF